MPDFSKLPKRQGLIKHWDDTIEDVFVVKLTNGKEYVIFSDGHCNSLSKWSNQLVELERR